MKHCNTCATDKPKTEFHTRKASKDGLSPKCRTCAKAYDDARLQKPDRVEMRKAYAKTPQGIERGNKSKNAWAARNPKKVHASNTVANAVRDGKMTRKPCEVCGSTYRIHGHHDDYDKIYDVRWLCSEHHRLWHRLNGEAANPQ